MRPESSRGSRWALPMLAATVLLAACAAGKPDAPLSSGQAAVAVGTEPPPAPGAAQSPRFSGPLRPAMLASHPPLSCLASIEAVAERASGSPVQLGPAAFSRGDELVLTRRAVRGPDGRPLEGMKPPPSPIVLKLSRDDKGCFIRQVPATGGLPGASSTPSETVVPVADPVALPACQCQDAPD